MSEYQEELQEWIKNNEPSDSMRYKECFWEQIQFVRDIIPGLLFTYEDALRHPIKVVNTHKSKSIDLPVYQILLPNGIVITMQCNFYNWKISVNSPIDIKIDPMGLFNPEKAHYSIYCEGFPVVYESYSDNKKQFTIKIGGYTMDYKVFAFFWILGKSLGLKLES